MNNKCCWVLVQNSPGVVAVYCHKTTAYKVKHDDDGNRMRIYEPFCELHATDAAAQRNDDEVNW